MSPSTAATLRRLIVSVTDLQASFRFYRDLLGLEVRSHREDVAELVTSDGVTVLLHQRPVDRGDAAMAIGFAVPELDDVVAAWSAAGGSVIDPPAQQPWGERMATVRDSDGHILCISESRAPQSVSGA